MKLRTFYRIDVHHSGDKLGMYSSCQFQVAPIYMAAPH